MRMPNQARARFSVRQLGLSALAGAAALALVLCLGTGCSSTSQQTTDTPGTTDTPSTQPSNQGTTDTPADNPGQSGTSTTETPGTTDTPGTTTPATSAGEAPVAQEQLISPAALNSALAGDTKSYYLIDIRSYAEYSSGCITGSLNIPAGKQFELRVREIPTSTPIVLISDPSYSGIENALSTLRDNGYSTDQVYVLEGGINAWIKAGLPTEALMDYSC